MEATRLVEILRAAGEPTRLRLLALVAEGELSVKSLAEILGQSQPRVSRHLKLLAESGLISRVSEGAWVYYRLADTTVGGGFGSWLLAQLDADDAERRRDLVILATLRKAQQAQAAAYFAQVAGHWDALRLHVSEESVEAALLERLARRPVETLIDLGTGTGRMLELLSAHYRQAIGIDASREMLGVARAKLAAARITHAQVRLGDIADLGSGFPPADCIVIHQVLHYFDEPGRALIEAKRVLKPGGDVLIADLAPHGLETLRGEFAHRRLGLSPGQMVEWAAHAGLAVAEFTSFPPRVGTGGLTACLWRLAEQPAP